MLILVLLAWNGSNTSTLINSAYQFPAFYLPFKPLIL
ncbi:Uncharacterised protein [Buttiauxella agrestis]|uniref:Uncharacterized protein n=1 Tax=Buttiauxella agrestis TaxID=82977 RepID=A0A381C8R1_9ENTR|nr:Uncharacterised protein [Buttiauxella agrestis]